MHTRTHWSSRRPGGLGPRWIGVAIAALAAVASGACGPSAPPEQPSAEASAAAPTAAMLAATPTAEPARTAGVAAALSPVPSPSAGLRSVGAPGLEASPVTGSVAVAYDVGAGDRPDLIELGRASGEPYPFTVRVPRAWFLDQEDRTDRRTGARQVNIVSGEDPARPRAAIQIIYASHGGASVNLETEIASAERTLRDRGLSAFTTELQQPIAVNGVHGQERRYTYGFGGQSVRQRSVYLLTARHIFSVTLLGPEELARQHDPLFGDVLSTFVVDDRPSLVASPRPLAPVGAGTKPTAVGAAPTGPAAGATTAKPEGAATATGKPTAGRVTPARAEGGAAGSPIAARPPARPTERGASESGALRALEDKWYQDSDGNAIPDFLELELGMDPHQDDCPIEQCGDGAAGSDLLTRDRNTLLVLDSSGSMAEMAGGETKMAAAKASLERYVRMTPDLFKLGFLVYGHTGSNADASRPESCAAIDLLAPIGEVRREQFPTLLTQFQPTGWTPIAGALTRAAEAFRGKEGGLNRIILVSDGIETCDGDPVAVAQQVHGQGIAVQIDVVGFDIQSSADVQQLRRIAEVTGGTYHDARSRADLDQYFNEQGRAAAQTMDAMTCVVRIGSTRSWLCDQGNVNRAIGRITEQGYRVPYTSPEGQAHRELTERIRERREERQKKFEEVGSRYDELARQHRELVDQLNRAVQNR